MSLNTQAPAASASSHLEEACPKREKGCAKNQTSESLLAQPGEQRAPATYCVLIISPIERHADEHMQCQTIPATPTYGSGQTDRASLYPAPFWNEQIERQPDATRAPGWRGLPRPKQGVEASSGSRTGWRWQGQGVPATLRVQTCSSATTPPHAGRTKRVTRHVLLWQAPAAYVCA